MPLLSKVRHYKVLFDLIQNVPNKIEKNWNTTNLYPDYLMHLIDENMTPSMSLPTVSTAKPTPHHMATCYRSATFSNHHVRGHNPINNMPKHVTLMF